MPINPQQLEQLVAHPSETLNVELKSWIDPSQPEGAAKVVKACLALRNRNGGFLVIGVDDKSLRAEPCPAGFDHVALFAPDRMQELISRYASEAFAVEVVLVQSAVGGHPVVAVPGGVRAPVAIRKPLAGPKGELLHVGDVPFRTLNANGRVSTAAARPEDWRDLVEICFDNREADVAGFLRRHLSALTPELLAAFATSAASAPPALPNRALAFLESCHARAEVAIAAPDVRAKPGWGGWEFAVVLDPPLTDGIPDQNLLNRIYAANPSYGGWPIWLDLRGNPGSRAVVKDGGWEITTAFNAFYDSLDFSRIEPAGRLYTRRPHFDDAMADARRAKPAVILDPVPLIADVGEALASALIVARAIGATDDTSIGFVCRWSGLKGRRLATFSPGELGKLLLGGSICEDGAVTTTVTMPANTSPLAVSPSVGALTRPLFAAFMGFSVSDANLDRIVTMRLERKTA